MRNDLDLNTLIAAQRGNQPPSQSRGVDQFQIKNRRDFQHRWAMVVTFAIQEELLRDMTLQKERVAAATARGREAPQLQPISLPMTNENLASMEGPGCIKCNTHWENPEAGYGKLCEVSDQAYLLQQQEGEAQLAYDRDQVMAEMVEHARQRPEDFVEPEVDEVVEDMEYHFTDDDEDLDLDLQEIELIEYVESEPEVVRGV